MDDMNKDDMSKKEDFNFDNGILPNQGLPLCR